MQLQENKHDLIVAIVNHGFADDVMDAAREKGATGGTILRGKGTGVTQNEFYNMILQADKDTVLIVVTKEIRNAVMDSIMHSAGLSTKANGIVISLPVDEFAILSRHHDEAND